MPLLSLFLDITLNGFNLIAFIIYALIIIFTLIHIYERKQSNK